MSPKPPALTFHRDFDPQPGSATRLHDAPLLRRITADNPSAMTFRGTNSYLLGSDSVAIIDPGPWLASHLDALEAAVAATGYASHIIVTHHHADHCDAVAELKQRLGVPVFGPAGAVSRGVDIDVQLFDGDEVQGLDWRLEALATPGHCADHLCFHLQDSDWLFSGDHVMGWSSSVILPPDGSLTDYLASLDRLLMHPSARRYLPGHGEIIADGPAQAAALKAHRQQRSEQVRTALDGRGPVSPDALLAVVYPDLPENLRPAARASLQAHLDALHQSGDIHPVGEDGWQRSPRDGRD